MGGKRLPAQLADEVLLQPYSPYDRRTNDKKCGKLPHAGGLPPSPYLPVLIGRGVPPAATGGKGAALDLRTFEKVRSKLLFWHTHSFSTDCVGIAGLYHIIAVIAMGKYRKNPVGSIMGDKMAVGTAD